MTEVLPAVKPRPCSEADPVSVAAATVLYYPASER
jgi:hypothetical protein